MSCNESLESTAISPHDSIDSVIFKGVLFVVGMIVLYLTTRFIIKAFSGKLVPRKNKKDERNNPEFLVNQDDEISRLKREKQDLMKELKNYMEKCETLEKEKNIVKEKLIQDAQQIVPSDEQPSHVVTLSVEPISSKTSVKIKYSKFADENALFPHTHLTSSDDGSCYYKLEIDDETRMGMFEPIISDLNIYSFKNNKSMLLLPYCELLSMSDTWSGIKILDRGTLKYGDSAWTVENKCKIELI